MALMMMTTMMTTAEMKIVFWSETYFGSQTSVNNAGRIFNMWTGSMALRFMAAGALLAAKNIQIC